METAVIQSMATAVPGPGYSIQDMQRAAQQWLAGHPESCALYERLLGTAQISRRHYVLPIDELLALRSVEERSLVFKREGLKLAEQVVSDCLLRAKVRPQDIQQSIFTSCSVPVIPALDAGVISKLNFSPSIRRIPLYQHGCIGGAVGLSLACESAALGQSTLLTSVELCSLVYQGGDLSRGNLVGSALFADGAAAVVVGPGHKGLVHLGSVPFLLPDSTHLMGYDLENDGAHLRLDRELPGELLRAAPSLLRDFLGAHNLNPEDVNWWLFHPGGVKIIQALEQEFKLKSEQSRFSWEVLDQFGNMSSASILFVLKNFLDSGCYSDRDKVLMLGVGPGLSLEFLLFEYRA